MKYRDRNSKWYINVKYKGRKLETVDEYDNEADAILMLREYRMAFASPKLETIGIGRSSYEWD